MHQTDQVDANWTRVRTVLGYQRTDLFILVRPGAFVCLRWEYRPMGGRQISSLDDISVVALHIQIPLNKLANPPENVGSWNLQKH